MHHRTPAVRWPQRPGWPAPGHRCRHTAGRAPAEASTARRPQLSRTWWARWRARDRLLASAARQYITHGRLAGTAGGQQLHLPGCNIQRGCVGWCLQLLPNRGTPTPHLYIAGTWSGELRPKLALQGSAMGKFGVLYTAGSDRFRYAAAAQMPLSNTSHKHLEISSDGRCCGRRQLLAG